MIYLDNAATTQMLPQCVDCWESYGVDNFYNPSALYGKSLVVANEIKSARNIIAKSIGAKQDEIIFTASGSEADNLALLCSIKSKKGKVIVGNVEHSAIFACANELKNRGYDVIFAPSDKYGRCDIDKLATLLDENVCLVSIMAVCNETGAKNDLKAISQLIKEKSPKALFHSDGVQAFGKIHINVKSLGVDMFSMSAHKIHGPKGVGALYVRKGIFLRPIILGGGQESGIRSATENVAGIMAFSMATQYIVPKIENNREKYLQLQEYLCKKLNSNFQNIIINTDITNSSGNIISFAFDNVRGEVVVHCMEQEGIILGTGSACSASKSSKRIPVALGIDSKYHQGMLRISFNETTSKDELDIVVEKLKEVVTKLEQYQKV